MQQNGILEAHTSILKFFSVEHAPRTPYSLGPSALMGEVMPLQKPPFLLDRVGISEMAIHYQ